eukprot:2173766-Rhodomonas_salina.2
MASHFRRLLPVVSEEFFALFQLLDQPRHLRLDVGDRLHILERLDCVVAAQLSRVPPLHVIHLQRQQQTRLTVRFRPQ